MATKKSEFRRSIWKTDGSYPAGPEPAGGEWPEDVWKLAWVNLSKLRIAPAAFDHLSRVLDAAEPLRTKVPVEPEDIVQYLKQTHTKKGTGVRTAICMLAVATAGRFPPIDRKIVAGMKRWKSHGPGKTNLVNADAIALMAEGKAGESLTKFGRAYLGTALKIWNEAKKIEKGNCQAADERIASCAPEKRKKK